MSLQHVGDSRACIALCLVDRFWLVSQPAILLKWTTNPSTTLLMKKIWTTKTSCFWWLYKCRNYFLFFSISKSPWSNKILAFTFALKVALSKFELLFDCNIQTWVSMKYIILLLNSAITCTQEHLPIVCLNVNYPWFRPDHGRAFGAPNIPGIVCLFH